MMPRTNDKELKKARGFTILEVAGAATVLALTLTGMIGVVESGSRILDLSRKQTVATQILHSELEEIRMTAWTTVSGYVSASPVSTTIDPNFSATQTGFSSTRLVTTLQVDGNNNPTLVQVTFTVNWTGITGRAYSRSSTTHIGKNGIYTSYQRS
jgi:Tfp pilus assembly protein PilV